LTLAVAYLPLFHREPVDVEKVGAVLGVWGLNSGVESVGAALIL